MAAPLDLCLLINLAKGLPDIVGMPSSALICQAQISALRVITLPKGIDNENP